MNEERFDDREIEEIEMLYKENVQCTAPDMEKLWSRIESNIDAEEKKNKTDEAARRTQIRTTNRRKKIGALITAAAACFIIVGVGVHVFSTKNSPEKSNSPQSEMYSSGSELSGDTTGGAAVGTDNKKSAATSAVNRITEQEQNAEEKRQDIAVPEGEAAETKTEGSDNTKGGEADAMTNDADRTQEETAEQADNINALKPNSNQTAGTDTLNEEEILGLTDNFLDARVKGTEQIGDKCYYDLEIVRKYGKEGDTEGGTLRLASEIPLGLTVGAEYLIPVHGQENEILPVLYRTAQIMFTGDGRVTFPEVLTTLAEGAEDFDAGMKTAPAERINKLIEKWRNS